MGFFEDEIAKAVVLVLFVPLIISSGGNSGSQATSLIIRAIALGDVSLQDWWRVMRRELFAGFALSWIAGQYWVRPYPSLAAQRKFYGPHCVLVAAIFADLSAWCCLGALRVRCCRLFCAGWDWIPRRLPRRSWQRSWT